MRKKGGPKVHWSSQNINYPSDEFVLPEWDPNENIRKFCMSDDLKKVMEQAGVTGIPHIQILKEVQKSKALLRVLSGAEQYVSNAEAGI
jgi:hypothetical protein